MSESEPIRRTREFERGAVRDIRDDLIERLEATNAEMASARTLYDAERRELEQRFHERLSALGERQKALGVLIDAEGPSVSKAGRPRPARDLRLPLQDFILNGLNMHGAMLKDTIRDMVERAGYANEGESAGRMVHTTLLNAMRSGRILVRPEGLYELAPVGIAGTSGTGLLSSMSFDGSPPDEEDRDPSD